MDEVRFNLTVRVKDIEEIHFNSEPYLDIKEELNNNYKYCFFCAAVAIISFISIMNNSEVYIIFILALLGTLFNLIKLIINNKKIKNLRTNTADWINTFIHFKTLRKRRRQCSEEKIEKIKSVVAESIRVKNEILNNPEMIAMCEKIADEIAEAFRQDKKVLFCGNGGSAADAQHLAAEFSGRFYFDRPPLDAEALHVNSSYVTAVGNDYGYDQIFSRVLKAKGRKGDFIFGISTSGNSPNFLKAFEVARERGMVIVAMTGATGGKMKDNCDYLLNVPSNDTPRIQESHIMLGHIICELVEEALFDRPQ